MTTRPRTFRIFVSLLVVAIIATGGCVRKVAAYQTCGKCGSTRKLSHGREVILYRGPSFSACAHRWEGGICRTAPTMVSDGVIVLVRRHNAFGAFILRGQEMEPETADVEWYYRTDGRGTFRRAETKDYVSGKRSGLLSGTRPMESIKFGPFCVEWSGAETGRGYLYYPRFSHEPVQADDTRICVTGERNIELVDATDPKWVFKGSPADPGIAGPPSPGSAPARKSSKSSKSGQTQ